MTANKDKSNAILVSTLLIFGSVALISFSYLISILLYDTLLTKVGQAAMLISSSFVYIAFLLFLIILFVNVKNIKFSFLKTLVVILVSFQPFLLIFFGQIIFNFSLSSDLKAIVGKEGLFCLLKYIAMMAILVLVFFFLLKKKRKLIFNISCFLILTISYVILSGFSSCVTTFLTFQNYHIAHLKLGKQIPDIKLKSLTSDSLSFRQYAGKVVLVEFWSTTCSGCIKSTPMLVEFYEKMPKDHFQMIGISNEISSEDSIKILNYCTKKNVTWLQCTEAQLTGISKYFQILMIPYYCVLNKENKIKYVGLNPLYALQSVEKMVGVNPMAAEIIKKTQ